jgi:hypothetical protein
VAAVAAAPKVEIPAVPDAIGDASAEGEAGAEGETSDFESMFQPSEEGEEGAEGGDAKEPKEAEEGQEEGEGGDDYESILGGDG